MIISGIGGILLCNASSVHTYITQSNLKCESLNLEEVVSGCFCHFHFRLATAPVKSQRR